MPCSPAPFRPPKTVIRDARASAGAWVLLLTSACSDWPVYAHLSADTGGYAQAGTPVGDALGQRVTWDSSIEVTSNDWPASALGLAAWQGMNISGRTEGFGWDLEADQGEGPCGAPEDYPFASPGAYSGDVDWLHLETADAGTLCGAVAMANLPTDAVYDFMLYTLDTCGRPTGVVADDGYPLGLDSMSQTTAWARAVQPGEHYGVFIAGWRPDDALTVVEWKMSLSLVETGDAERPGACPSAPEAP